MNNIRIYFKKVHKNAVTPSYIHPSDAACDLRVVEGFTIEPGQRYLADIGIQIAIPEGFEAQIRPRSGQAWKRGLTVINSPGTIDSSYRGNIMVALINLGQEAITVKVAERVAQMKFSPVYTGNFIEVQHLDKTARGEGGFGSFPAGYKGVIMEKIRKNYCGLLDGELSEVIDSTDENDRIKALFLMLKAEINDKLLKSRRENTEAEERILILGRDEVEIISAYTRNKVEDYYEQLKEKHEDDMPLLDVSDKVTSLWGMTIYIVETDSFIGIATGPGFYVFAEDFESRTKQLSFSELEEKINSRSTNTGDN